MNVTPKYTSGFFNDRIKSGKLDEFYRQQILQIPQALLNESRANLSLRLEEVREIGRKSMLDKAEYRKSPEACALLRALITLRLEAPVQQRTVRLDTFLPIVTIRHVFNSAGLGLTIGNSALYRLLGEQASDPVARAAAEEELYDHLLDLVGAEESERLAHESISRAEILWNKYRNGVEPRTRLQSPIFKHPLASALLVYLLEETNTVPKYIAHVLNAYMEERGESIRMDDALVDNLLQQASASGGTRGERRKAVVERIRANLSGGIHAAAWNQFRAMRLHFSELERRIRLKRREVRDKRTSETHKARHFIESHKDKLEWVEKVLRGKDSLGGAVAIGAAQEKNGDGVLRTFVQVRISLPSSEYWKQARVFYRVLAGLTRLLHTEGQAWKNVLTGVLVEKYPEASRLKLIVPDVLLNKSTRPPMAHARPGSWVVTEVDRGKSWVSEGDIKHAPWRVHEPAKKEIRRSPSVKM